VLPHTLILLGLSLGGIAVGEAGRVLPEAAPFAEFLPSGFRPARTEGEGRYQAAERSVSNWQWEAATRLEPGPVAALAALVEADRPVVTRCVKLNNYWCIKSAGWSGEIGTDDEGHVGFVSAERGADAAATLLRRYYLEFGRKSALDIVRRWAPAECRLVDSAGAAAVLAVRGIGGTVRARYLASRRRVRVSAVLRPGAAKAAPTPRISAVVPRPLPMVLMPDIAVGTREKPLTLSSTLPYRVARPRPPARLPRAAPVASASASNPAAKPPLPPPAPRSGSVASAKPPPTSLTPPLPPPRSLVVASAPPSPGSPAPPLPPPAPRLSCAPDEQRLRNYAGRIVEGLDRGLEDDLELFTADGTPTANLKPVMLAMSAFELGTLRAGVLLVEEAVERQRARAGRLTGAGDRSEASDTDPRSGLRLR
jgi:hypothetical protein